MGRTGRKKTLSTGRHIEKIGDVKLSEFADSTAPCGRGRMSKSKNVLAQVRRISTSEDVDVIPEVDIGEELNSKPSGPAGATLQVNKDDNENYTEYPLKIWLLVSEYIRPEDVNSFSLVCKSTLSVVNTPLFWIRLYKRYFKKIDMPKCLSHQGLEIKKCLRQRVVRSLYYFYPPFSVRTFGSTILPNETLVGTLCLNTGIRRIQEKDQDSTDESRWLYTFKLCGKNSNEIWMHTMPSNTNSNDINYNPESNCRLLKIICNEYVAIPNVIGMRLRNIDSNNRSTILKFSSAPLSKMVNNELGMVTVYLHHTLKPSAIPWWHPDYWDHGKCCNKKPYAIICPIKTDKFD